MTLTGVPGYTDFGIKNTVLSETVSIGENFSTKSWYWGIDICTDWSHF